MSDQPCACAECVRAGCDQPVVTLAASGRNPQRELHGRELVKFYQDRAARKAFFTKLIDDLASKGIAAQRGDEPR